MKRFIGFVRKEFLHIFRDWRTMSVLFGMPVAQLMLFGYVITNEIKDAPMAIMDPSHDTYSMDITSRLTSSGYFLSERNISNHKEIEPVFREGKVKIAVVFPNNFIQQAQRERKATIQVITDASEPNTANILASYTESVVLKYAMSLQKSSGMGIRIEPKMMYNPTLKGVYLFVPGLIAMLLMLISALMTSITITREKELGNMEILLVSPLKPAQIILGKVLPYFLLSFSSAVLILLTGYFIFGVPIVGSIVLLLAETMLFILMALSLGILISTVTSSQQVAMMISMVALMLPTILLSGFIFPVENMPEVMQWLCKAMPPKYFITIVRGIMLKGNGLDVLWDETLVLSGMTLFLMILSMKKFKKRLA
ncbi:MAG: multidrug ABC transporter permease [Bacteroidetes bacterium HGW-Bacteroidetes-21]|nr:MAG: multidrug ABC transporter permease [Bacteroidetes bacterium HGW-Bacteroidetes-21]